MSDFKLLHTLRMMAATQGTHSGEGAGGRLAELAADRIEELEAKLSESEALLERALEALATILCNCVGDAERCGSKAAIAELTGGKDE